MVWSTPKVSILVPTYNHEKFIAETLESILCQTFTDFEAIVADDASTDNTKDVIAHYAAKDKRIKPIYNIENIGLSKNFNNILRQAVGQYVAGFAGDDIMFPTSLEARVDFLDQHSEFVVCMHDMEVFDSDTGEVLYVMSSRFTPISDPDENLFFTNWLFSKRDVKGCGASLLVRSSYYLANEFDDRLPYLNEVLHGIENFAADPAGKWHTIPEVLGRYRRHSGNLSSHTNYDPLEETVLAYTIALHRYPQYTKRIRNKIDFILFKHLLFDLHPREKHKAYEKQFLNTAGCIKYLYLKLCRGLLKAKLLYVFTAPLRRINRLYGR